MKNAFSVFGLLFIITGFLIGIIYGVTEKYNWLSPQWRIFLTIGFCGGFTTFSSFSYENFNLIQQQNYITPIIYIFSSIIIGLIFTVIGFKLVK